MIIPSGGGSDQDSGSGEFYLSSDFHLGPQYNVKGRGSLNEEETPKHNVNQTCLTEPYLIMIARHQELKTQSDTSHLGMCDKCRAQYTSHRDMYENARKNKLKGLLGEEGEDFLS